MQIEVPSIGKTLAGIFNAPVGGKALIGDLIKIGLVILLISWLLPTDAALTGIVGEVVEWGVKLIGLAAVGLVILMLVMVSFRTVLDSFTVRKEVVAKLHEALTSEDKPASPQTLLAGAILAGLTMLSASIIISICLIAPYV